MAIISKVVVEAFAGLYMNRLIVIQQSLGHGAVIGYSDLGHESTSMNDTSSCTLQENLRIDFAYHANHALLLTAKQMISAFYGQMSYIHPLSTVQMEVARL